MSRFQVTWSGPLLHERFAPHRLWWILPKSGNSPEFATTLGERRHNRDVGRALYFVFLTAVSRTTSAP
jgi:hypothetical protein